MGFHRMLLAKGGKVESLCNDVKSAAKGSMDSARSAVKDSAEHVKEAVHEMMHGSMGESDEDEEKGSYGIFGRCGESDDVDATTGDEGSHGVFGCCGGREDADAMTSKDGIVYRVDDLGCITPDMLVHLWHSVGWENGSSKAPCRLMDAMYQSAHVIVAWKGDMLIGLCSCISDGLNVWISYMVVDKLYQGKGIGGHMLDLMVSMCPQCRIWVQTADAPKFYEGHGFEEMMHSLRMCNWEGEIEDWDLSASYGL